MRAIETAARVRDLQQSLDEAKRLLESNRFRTRDLKFVPAVGGCLEVWRNGHRLETISPDQANDLGTWLVRTFQTAEVREE